MIEETIVAVYETPDRAEAAVNDLRLAHIPEASIECHAVIATDAAAEHPGRVPGFWSRLIGSRTGGDGELSNGDLPAGATVVTVRVITAQAFGVIEILDNHGPIGLDERAFVDGHSVSTDTPAHTQTGGVEGDIPVRGHGISGGSFAPAAEYPTETLATTVTPPPLPAAYVSAGDARGPAVQWIGVGKRGAVRVPRFVVEPPL